MKKRPFCGTVTLYNHIGETDGVVTYRKTVLRGVCLFEKSVAKGRDLIPGSRAVLYISEKHTSSGSKYLPYEKWVALENKKGYYTLSPYGDCFTAGENAATVPEDTDGYYRITAVEPYENGSAGMRHMKVTAR